MSKNKKLLSYTSFPRIDIIKGTGIRDKKHTSQKNKKFTKIIYLKKDLTILLEK